MALPHIPASLFVNSVSPPTKEHATVDMENHDIVLTREIELLNAQIAAEHDREKRKRLVHRRDALLREQQFVRRNPELTRLMANSKIHAQTSLNTPLPDGFDALTSTASSATIDAMQQANQASESHSTGT